jgi:hypothetical protein
MKSETFKSYIALLTALVTVLGALAAGLAAVSVSNASDEDFLGVDASIRAQKAEIGNHVLAFEHYRAYTTYVRYKEMGNLLKDSDQQAAAQDAWGVAEGLTFFFLPRYIDPGGAYNIEREIQETWADSAQTEDLNYEPYFEASNRLRSRSSILAGDMIVFAVSFWFFTLAQTTERGVKYLWAGAGVLLALTGILLLLVGSVAT